MAKSKNWDILSNQHYDDLYSQGSVAAPSGATLRKFFGAPKQRKRQKIPAGELGTLSEGTLNDALHGVTDYHDAMMYNIAQMHAGESVWRFRNKPKSQRKIDTQAFEYVKQLREFYKIDEEDTYDRRDLKEIVIKNKKSLPTALALKVLALEELNKKWSKGYLPFKTYDEIKKQAEKSLDLADEKYKFKGGKDPEIRKKALEQTIKELRG